MKLILRQCCDKFPVLITDIARPDTLRYECSVCKETTLPCFSTLGSESTQELAAGAWDTRNTKSVRRYNQFTYWEVDGHTVIGDDKGATLATFSRVLSEATICYWCDGYDRGHKDGIVTGSARKLDEIKHVLGL